MTDEIAKHLAGERKVDIATEVTRHAGEGTFSDDGLKLGRDLRDAILIASGRVSRAASRGLPRKPKPANVQGPIMHCFPDIVPCQSPLYMRQYRDVR